MYRIIFLSYLITMVSCAFILEKYLPTCDKIIKINKVNETITVAGNDRRVFIQNTEIVFNLCGSVKHEICGDYGACIKTKSDNSFRGFGEKFEHDKTIEKLILRSSIPDCKLSVKWSCSLSVKEEPSLRVLDSCDFEITLALQFSYCADPCSTFINTQQVDFTPLKGKYVVHAKNQNFSVFLCGSNPDCGDDASSCDITKHIPISSGSELITFKVDTNEVEFRKKSNFNHSPKIFQLSIKCNWDVNASTMHYREVPNQGKTYKFEMESSHACIKLPPVCQFTDNIYKFNLTKAYSNVGYVEVENVPKPREIFLNICGPLKLPQSGNICDKTNSQICEVNNGIYINKGSIYKKPEIVDEHISLSLITGSKCQSNVSREYKTIIDFHCSKSNENPKYVDEKDCSLFLRWNTPAACPEYNIDICAQREPDPFKCVYNQTNKYFINSYDLNKLYSRSGYAFRSDLSKNFYDINICGPVNDEKVFCEENANVIVKYPNEIDIRRKVKSYGQFTKFYVKENNLVLETTGGNFCNDMMTDYKSYIFFECDKGQESMLSLKDENSCKIEFLWKTKYACPTEIETTKPCLFDNPFNTEYMLDFTHLQKPSLRTEISGTEYLFDLCGNDRDDCLSKNCIYVPVNKSVVIYGNKTHLEFTLNRECDDKNLFNKTLLELVCEEISENDHFVYKGLHSCTLVLMLKTSKVCFKKELIVPLVDEPSDSVEYKVDRTVQNKYVAVKKPNADLKPTRVVPDCTVKNHYTGFELNISELNINVSSKICPDIVFNVDNEIVYLIYDLPDSCRKENGKMGDFDFRIHLKCKTSDLHNSTREGLCSKNVTLELPAFCKLLETNTLKASSSNTIVISVVAITITVVLIILGAVHLIRKRKFGRRAPYTSVFSSGPYEKDADL